ncbi:MAG: archease [Minisyncoccales bacterium]
MKKNYKVLRHTADLKIKAFGKSVKEIFQSALLAMFESIKPEIKERIVFRKIKIKNGSLENLFVAFLNKALYLSQVKKEIYFKIKFQRYSFKKNFFLEGILEGKKIKSWGLDIKAVTYHQLKIKKEKKEWTVVFVCDI